MSAEMQPNDCATCAELLRRLHKARAAGKGLALKRHDIEMLCATLPPLIPATVGEEPKASQKQRRAPRAPSPDPYVDPVDPFETW